jgi:hypothetical protein
VTTAIGATKQPCPAPESHPAQRSFGGIVRDADSPVIDKAGEGLPASNGGLMQVASDSDAQAEAPRPAESNFPFRCYRTPVFYDRYGQQIEVAETDIILVWWST